MSRVLSGVLGALALACAPAVRQPAAARQPSDLPAQLSPGDVLRITVWRAPGFSGEFVVGPDSTLVHPLFQAVKVAGVPLSVVKDRLRAFLGTYEQNPQVVLEPLFVITVAGEVRQPGVYTLPQGTTIGQAIARAGGTADLGRLSQVRVLRRGGEWTIDVTRPNSQYGAIPIASGDQIVVGRRSQFNFVRDVVGPLSSLTAAVAALVLVARR